MKSISREEQRIANFWGCFHFLVVGAYLFGIGYGIGYIWGVLLPGTELTFKTIVFSLAGAGLGAYLSALPDWWRRYQIRRRLNDAVGR